MIFVFDWGYTTTKYMGPLSKDDVDFDLNTEMVWLVRMRVWFRLFFIPTIPTRSRYFFISATNDNRQEINKTTFSKFRNLALLNARLMNDEIDDEPYWREREKLDFD